MVDLQSILLSPNPAGRAFALLGVVSLFVLAEYLYAKLSEHDERHDGAEAAASMGVALGDVTSRVLLAGFVAVPFVFLYQHRLLEIDHRSPVSWGVLFLALEFFYYWFHRASHRVRWLWATHAVHHSATKFNLSAAVRLGWTGQLTGAFVFFLPLAWIGFHPGAIGAVLSLGLLYQFFLHTSADVHFGPLESVLNTPTHHRVHHASNEACLDVNYGSVLIIYDRLFGTFATAPQGEPLRYGLKGRVPSNNVLRIALGEWVHLFRDVKAAQTWRKRLLTLFGPP